MPRLPHSLLLRAHATNPLLPILLRTCRDLPSARNELRWLREHALELAQKRASEHAPEHVPVHCHARIAQLRRTHTRTRTRTRTGWRAPLRRMCEDRGRGKPLQYILGTQPFGEVEILCRPGVLVPRPETESYTNHLAHLILSRRREQQQQQQSTWPLRPPQSPGSNPPAPGPAPTPAESTPPLRILDLCTGTGCIPLLLHSLLSSHIADLQILGIDISPLAISLACRNRAHNIARKTLSPVANSQIRFLRGDVLRAGRASVHEAGRRKREARQDGRKWRNAGEGEGERGSAGEGKDYLSEEWHVVTCNPPYVSPRAFNTCTARSVRTFEPKLALVPPSIARRHAESDAENDADSPSATSTPTTPPLRGQRERERCDNDDGGDAFYPSILSIARQVKARVLVMEVGDMAQAERVAGLASAARTGEGKRWEKVDIWRDWMDQRHAGAGAGVGAVSGRDVGLGNGDEGKEGQGEGRVVVCFRGWG